MCMRDSITVEMINLVPKSLQYSPSVSIHRVYPKFESDRPKS